MTDFKLVRNNAATTITAAKSLGATTLTVADVTAFGTPTSTNPIRLTLCTAASLGTTTETEVIYHATGVSGSTFTGVTVAPGETDRAFAVGDAVEARWTAQAVQDIHDAINDVETDYLSTTVAAATYVATAALSAYVTTSSLTSTLTSYVTTSSLTSTLASYSPLAGSGSIVTVGTVANGVWNATAIGPTKGGTGLTAIGAANQIPGTNAAGTAYEWKTLTQGSGITITHSAGGVTIAATGGGGSTTIGGAVGGSPTSGCILFTDAGGLLAQTANLRWDIVNQDLVISSSATTLNNTLLLIDHTGATGQPRFKINTANTGSGNVGVCFQTQSTDKIGFFGVVVGSFMDYGVYDFQSATYSMYIKGNTGRVAIGMGTSPGGMLHIQARDTSTQTLVLQAFTLQTGTSRLLQIQNSAGTEIGWIDAAANASFGTMACGTTTITGNVTVSVNVTAISFINGSQVIQSGTLYRGGGATGSFNFRRNSSGGSYNNNTPQNEWMIANGDIWNITASQSSGTYCTIAVMGSIQESTAITLSGTATIRSHSIVNAIGNGALTFTGSNPLTGSYTATTFNLAAATTGQVSAIIANPTFTSVGTDMVPSIYEFWSNNVRRLAIDHLGRQGCYSAAPTAAAGAAAGTSPTIGTPVGSDSGFTLNITTGTSPTTGILATVTFSGKAQNAPKTIQITASSANAAGVMTSVWVDVAGSTSSSFTIRAATALAASTSYNFAFKLEF